VAQRTDVERNRSSSSLRARRFARDRTLPTLSALALLLAALAGGCGDVTCKAPLVNCLGACRDLMNDAMNCSFCGGVCAADRVCQGGKCVVPSCATGLTTCSLLCVNLATDSNNCGACGTVCAAGTTCQASACAASVGCATGYTSCGGVCRFLAADPTNCGACGMVCPSGVCTNSVCQ
jgi:hypothetical protein